jgi:beta-barrel assembly-enhancing protease
MPQIQYRRTVISLNIAAVFLLFVSISVTSVNCGSRLGFNLFTDQDDVTLGKQLDEEIRNSPEEYPILTTHPHVKEYVEGIGSRILQSQHIQKRDVYPYQFEIIADDSTINAFCTPGGFIYVYTGLMRFVDDEATLAGVIGHEIAHAERRHATRRISAYYGVQILLAVVLGQNPGIVEQIAANLFTGLGFLANSRSDEKESDDFSMKYLADTEYYPGSIRFFFDKILEVSGQRGGSFERLLSTHPLPQDRVQHVEETAVKQNFPEPGEENLFRIRYQEFKRTLP